MSHQRHSPEHEEGWHAHHQGKTDADNPYDIGTDEAMDWEDGRSAAEYGDEPEDEQ